MPHEHVHTSRIRLDYYAVPAFITLAVCSAILVILCCFAFCCYGGKESETSRRKVRRAPAPQQTVPPPDVMHAPIPFPGYPPPPQMGPGAPFGPKASSFTIGGRSIRGSIIPKQQLPYQYQLYPGMPPGATYSPAMMPGAIPMPSGVSQQLVVGRVAPMASPSISSPYPITAPVQGSKVPVGYASPAFPGFPAPTMAPPQMSQAGASSTGSTAKTMIQQKTPQPASPSVVKLSTSVSSPKNKSFGVGPNSNSLKTLSGRSTSSLKQAKTAVEGGKKSKSLPVQAKGMVQTPISGRVKSGLPVKK